MNQVLAGVFDFCVNGTNPLFVFSTLGNSQFFSVLMSQLSSQNIAITTDCRIFAAQINTNLTSTAFSRWKIFNRNTGIPVAARILHQLAGIDAIER